MSEDDWIAAYVPKAAPKPGMGFDFGDGDTLVDGDTPGDVETLDAAGDDHVWTVLDGDEGITISAGRHFVNRLGYVVTEKPHGGAMIDVDLDS
jgi:hypothetical protein